MTTSPLGQVTIDRAETIEVDGLRFRDLDHDGELSPYEDWRLPVSDRVADLVGRLTREEKVGTVLHGNAPSVGRLGGLGVGTEYDIPAARALIEGRAITTLITRLGTAPRQLADQNNLLQDVAARARLGIPVTVSSDPRHHSDGIIGASVASSGFTTWPDALGLAAIGDVELVRRFGDCVRREYRAVGIHQSLAPQADLATSQRWPRIGGTFGEDPALVRALVGAYVEGVQGGRAGLGPESVAAVVKHWVGYGASRDGFDGHNAYGRFCAFPSDALDDHIEAFRCAFDASVAGVMPTYTILDGVEIDGRALEAVGGGFNRQLVEDLLRRDCGFDGLVLSDWAITRPATEATLTGDPPQTMADISMAWGMEHASAPERHARCLTAGVDQIGGEDDPEPLLAAVRAGLVDEARLDEAVGRILTQKMELGLFENPWTDPVAVPAVVADGATTAAADVSRGFNSSAGASKSEYGMKSSDCAVRASM